VAARVLPDDSDDETGEVEDMISVPANRALKFYNSALQMQVRSLKKEVEDKSAENVELQARADYYCADREPLEYNVDYLTRESQRAKSSSEDGWKSWADEITRGQSEFERMKDAVVKQLGNGDVAQKLLEEFDKIRGL